MQGLTSHSGTEWSCSSGTEPFRSAAVHPRVATREPPDESAFTVPLLLPERNQQMGEIAFSRHACYCHCRMGQKCHLDELITAWQGEGAHHFPQDRIIGAKVARAGAQATLGMRGSWEWTASHTLCHDGSLLHSGRTFLRRRRPLLRCQVLQHFCA